MARAMQERRRVLAELQGGDALNEMMALPSVDSGAAQVGACSVLCSADVERQALQVLADVSWVTEAVCMRTRQA
jgi:hypothetical protein